MNRSELVSVVLPVYNRAHLISRSLGSLLAQSYRNIEILVVDDGSSDDIEGAVAAFNDPRIRLLRQPMNRGAAAARNVGIAATRGNLITFQDSDDICVFDKIARQVEHLSSLPDDHIGTVGSVLFYHSLSEADYSKMKTYVQPSPHEFPLSGDLSKRTLHGNSFHLATLLVKKAALVAAGPADELLRNNEDWDLALRLTRQGKIGFLPEPLYLMQNHLSPEINRQRISRSSRYSAQSFVRITGKLRHQGYNGPDIAGHYTTAGLYLMRLGHVRFARRFFRAALRLTPMKGRLWAHYALSHTPRLRALLQNLLNTGS